MPRDQKTTLMLHQHEGLSYKEFFGIIGWSLKGIETSLYQPHE